jgi:hypothetical protein
MSKQGLGWGCHLRLEMHEDEPIEILVHLHFQLVDLIKASLKLV